MKLISWNLNQRKDAWRHLVATMIERDATIALVQEAVAPPADLDATLRIFGDPSLGTEPWRLPVPTGTVRRFASAVAIRGDAPVEVHKAKPLAEAAYDAAAISHPGQWVAARVGGTSSLWVISIYGIWERMPEDGDLFAEATLHRAISDLTPLLQRKDVKHVVLAGDLNIWHGYGGKPWADRYKTVFDRLAAYDLMLAGPRRVGGVPLEGCPCRGGEQCVHVRTYRHQRKANGTPYQNDFVFSRGVRLEACIALDADPCWAHSDHCPILVELAFP